jgi:ABC-2 type transport system ATP-binding protein
MNTQHHNITEVIAYISEARAVGLSADTIIAELLKAGWPQDLIRQAFAESLRAPMPHMHRQSAPSGSPRSIIEVRNLTKRYGTFTAVDNISFSVQAGETFGILGPNGAGKTTTLEMIEGLKKATGGSIILDGKDVATQTREVKSVIGVQLQASSFFEDLNLKELIEVFASLYNSPVDPMQALADVQLTEKAKNKVKELSGGQKQRFSIAIGLVNSPKVLFLDEPTTGLDPQARRNLWDLVSQIKARGTTVVLTTHYMDEAEILCDRIAIMDHARIVALDTTRNLLNSIGTAATIEFKSDSMISAESFSQLTGAQSASRTDDIYAISTTDPHKTLDELFHKARKEQFAIDQLTMKRATLEDVFLKLTGHQLRD